MWLQYRNDPVSAIAAYKKGLALGASKPLPTLFESSGLQFDFSAEMVGNLMKTVEEELDNNDNLVFYVIGPDKLGFLKHDDLEQLNAYDALSDSERDTISPEFE